MNSLLYHFLPIMLAAIISYIIYKKFDNKYAITNKIGVKLHIKREWMALFCFCFTSILTLVLFVVIDIQPTTGFILGGILAGITIGMMVIK